MTRDLFNSEIRRLQDDVLVLGSMAYLAGRYAGSPVREALVEAALAGMLGVLMIVSKSLLH